MKREPFALRKLTWRDSLPPRVRPRYWWAVLTCNWFVIGLRCQIRGHVRRDQQVGRTHVVSVCTICGNFHGARRL